MSRDLKSQKNLINSILCCLQERASSPEQFVGIILREKTPSSLMNEIVTIYNGEVRELLVSLYGNNFSTYTLAKLSSL